MKKTNSVLDTAILVSASLGLVCALLIMFNLLELIIPYGYLWVGSLLLPLIGLIGFKKNRFKFTKWIALTALAVSVFPSLLFILLGPMY